MNLYEDGAPGSRPSFGRR